MEVGAWMFGMNNNRYKDLGLRPFVYARSIGPWEATSCTMSVPWSLLRTLLGFRVQALLVWEISKC